MKKDIKFKDFLSNADTADTSYINTRYARTRARHAPARNAYNRRICLLRLRHLRSGYAHKYRQSLSLSNKNNYFLKYLLTRSIYE